VDPSFAKAIWLFGLTVTKALRQFPALEAKNPSTFTFHIIFVYRAGDLWLNIAANGAANLPEPIEKLPYFYLTI
jgi:hypothetical protein